MADKEGYSVTISKADLAAVRKQQGPMMAALALKMQYTGSDLTAAIAALLVRLAGGEPGAPG